MKSNAITRLGVWLLAAALLCSLFALPVTAADAETRPNIAQGKSAYASSNARGGDPHIGRRSSRFLTDGNETSFMVLHEDDPDPWFMVDLGEAHTIDTVALLWGADGGSPNAYATRYEVQVSTSDADWETVLDTADGWTTVAAVSDGAEETRTLSLAATAARYVRVKVLEKADKRASLFEIKVYDAPSGETEEEPMKVLFIGNSHTYTNEVPNIARDMLAEAGKKMEYRAITAGGQSLSWHAQQSDTIKEIRTDKYDFIVLQEKASGFDASEFMRGYAKLYAEIAETHSQPVLYMIWSNESLPLVQKTITSAYATAAKDTRATLAAAGVAWDIIRHTRTDLKLYQDGNHATPLGSYLAAASICYALTGRTEAFDVPDDDALAKRLKISVENARLMQETTCMVAQRGYDVNDLVWSGDGEVSGNLALGCTAYASSNQRGGDPHLGRRSVRFLTDGSEDNFIVLHEDDTDPWFMVDFGSAATFSALRLAWGSPDEPYKDSFAKRYEVQVSDTDGDDWRTIAAVGDGVLETRLLTFEPVTARYLRVRVLEKNNRYASLRELYAYKSSAETPEAEAARDELKKLVDAAIDESKYTEESVAAYKAAAADAKALLKKNDATYEALSAAITALKAALVEKPPVVEPTVDRAALDAAIADEVGDLSAYTDESARAYTEALNAAKAVAAKADATQEEVDAAAKALLDAKAALVLKEVVTLGDVNGDDAIDTADAVLVLQRAAELIGDNDLNAKAADVNGDGAIDTADAVLILQKAAELIERFPAE